MRDSRTASRKIALCAMLMALAMIFSYVEVLIPINLGVPGIKLGIHGYRSDVEFPVS